MNLRNEKTIWLKTLTTEYKAGDLKFYISLVIAFFLLPFVYLFWGDHMPYKFFELWKTSGTLGDWLIAGTPLFIWACVGTMLLSIINYKKIEKLREDMNLSKMVWSGTLISLRAGFLEEVGARWLIFLWAIVLSWVVNFVLFGFLGLGIIEWFTLNVASPVANWTTLGYLEPWLLHHEAGWIVGAGILGSNATFRDGHKYQGFIGYVNSWFLGMYFFWLTFTFGLWAAIIVHFVYDLLILAIIDPCINRLKFGSSPTI